MSTRQPVRSDSSVLLRSVCHCASAAHGRTAACRLEQCSWRESRLGQSRAGAERTVGAPKSSSPRGSTRKVPINIGSRSYSEGTSEPCYCGHTCSTDYTPRQVPTPGGLAEAVPYNSKKAPASGLRRNECSMTVNDPEQTVGLTLSGCALSRTVGPPPARSTSCTAAFGARRPAVVHLDQFGRSIAGVGAPKGDVDAGSDEEQLFEREASCVQR